MQRTFGRSASDISHRPRCELSGWLSNADQDRVGEVTGGRGHERTAQMSMVPSTSVYVSPPTQTSPLASWEIIGRPLRPRRVP